MRISPLCLALVAACSSPGAKTTPVPFKADQVIRIVHNQYRGPNSIFVAENLCGRDQVELRSRPLQPGEPAVAYIPDDVMEGLE